MPLIDPIVDARIAFILGITNIASLALVLLSCRCLLGIGLMKRIAQRGWYQKFYSMHCYYWWIFIVSVILHAIFALLVYGFPF